MNSNDVDFDWHRHGVWVVHTKDGTPLLATVGDTPHACRAEFLKHANRPWSECYYYGYYIQGYEPSKPIVVRKQQEVVTSDEAKWRYPATGNPEDQPPSGGVWLLTQGKIGVPGVWRDDGGFIAWMPKARRDKALEEELGL